LRVKNWRTAGEGNGIVERPASNLAVANSLPLKDAANYIQKLPKAEQDLEEWQAAVKRALLLVVELNGPTMTARIAVMRAFEPRLRSGV